MEKLKVWNYQSQVEIKLPQNIDNQQITRVSLDLAQMVKSVPYGDNQ